MNWFQVGCRQETLVFHTQHDGVVQLLKLLNFEPSPVAPVALCSSYSFPSARPGEVSRNTEGCEIGWVHVLGAMALTGLTDGHLLRAQILVKHEQMHTSQTVDFLRTFKP